MIFGIYLWFFCAVLHYASADVSWEKSNAQGFTAKADFSQEGLSLFEHLQIGLTLSYPKDYHPNLSEIRNHLFQYIGMGETPFSLLSEEIGIPKVSKEGFLSQTIKFVLAPKIVGSHFLTFLGILFEPNDPKVGSPVILMSGITPVTVTQPDIFPFSVNFVPRLLPLSQVLPVDLSPSNQEQLIVTEAKKKAEAQSNEVLFREKTIPWLPLGLISLAIFYSIYFIKKREAPRPLLVKKQNPKAIALQKLRNLPQGIPQKETYLQLTSILNQFIEESYSIKAPTMTSEEFFSVMSAHPLLQKADNKNSVQEFLNKADKIKFGHLSVSTEQTLQDFQFIRNLINKAS